MSVPSAAVQANITLGWDMGDMMVRFFNRAKLPQGLKADQSLVTAADIAISDTVVRFFQAQGRNVVSEESGRTAEYGDPDAEYLDPLDGTADFAEARKKLGRQSIAAFSLGSAVDGGLVRGVVNLPLLRVPRLYWAENGAGAFRVMERGGQLEQLGNEPLPQRGVILVSENHHLYIDHFRKNHSSSGRHDSGY